MKGTMLEAPWEARLRSSSSPVEDKDISTGLARFFTKEGITVRVSSKVKRISTTSNGMEVVIQGEDKETTEECDIVLVSTGRIPSSFSLGLENAAVERDDRGYIPVDSSMRTNRKHIWAAGDVVPTPMLANVALVEGEIAALSAVGEGVGRRLQALEITEIWYFCSVCRKRIDIEPNSDSHKAMMRYMEEHSWGYASCRRHQFHYPLVQRVQLKSI